MGNGVTGVKCYAAKDVEEEFNTKKEGVDLQHLNMEDFTAKEKGF